MPQIIKVLAIDGGGIRGIIPALLLTEIEKRTQKPIADLFDLLAGTSTGGILALALTKPDGAGKPAYTAQHLVSLYKNEGKEIFSRSVWHRIRAVGNVLEERYPAKGIEDVLEKYFSETRLRQALKPVIITSYQIERRIPWFFKSRHAKETSDHDYPMKVVARATSAAPTYFEPLKYPDDPLKYNAWIDGGVFANNPTLCAFAEAKKAFPQADGYLVVSLGTGELTRAIPYAQAKDWGLAGWAPTILTVVFHGVSETVDYQMTQILPPTAAGQRYYRFEPSLKTKGSDDMDDASDENLHELISLAEDLIADRQMDLIGMCRRLVA